MRIMIKQNKMMMDNYLMSSETTLHPSDNVNTGPQKDHESTKINQEYQWSNLYKKLETRNKQIL